MRVVVLGTSSPLLLDNAEIDTNGDGTPIVRSGHVINGGWRYRNNGVEETASAGRSVVNRWPSRQGLRHVVVPASMYHMDYNDVIAWARDLPVGE